MGLKIDNYKAIAGKGGMSGFTQHSKRIYNRYNDMTDNEVEIVSL